MTDLSPKEGNGSIKHEILKEMGEIKIGKQKEKGWLTI